jgi:hypothetical protein
MRLMDYCDPTSNAKHEARNSPFPAWQYLGNVVATC